MKPITFNTEMVRAILEGRKTQTRRPIKPRHKLRYKLNDILYVRETWRIGAWDENSGRIAVDYKADNFARQEWIDIEDADRFEKYWIQSSDEAMEAGAKIDEEGRYKWEPGQAPTKWRPSIFMPKEAARIFLKVTGVRVEKLQGITIKDAKSEGIICTCSENVESRCYKGSVGHFKQVWESIYSKTKYEWNKNPWVLVYELERAERSGE